MEVVSVRDYKIQKEHDEMKKQQAILLQETTHNTSPTPTTTASPPSSSTSPSHEFSFTISLDPHPPPKSTQNSHKHNTYINNNNNNNNNNHNNNNINHCLTSPTPEPVAAIGLSPADDIFFQGHLLPLHPSISPRSSTNSMDGFTLPTGNTSFRHHRINTFSDSNLPCNITANQTKPKSKSFSIFARPNWKKESPDDQDTGNPKKKLKLDHVAKLIKRYMKMVKPFMSFRRTKKSNTEYIRQPPHSFSSNCLSSRKSLPVEMNRGCVRRGRFSAPASIRTSPANSGILATGTLSPAKSTASDSTMEELQAAIQAAIAHCKNSIATEDKVEA